MAEFRIYLDGTLFTNSLDISGFPIEFERGIESKTMVSKFSENVVIVRDGYSYLTGLIETTGECAEVDVLIEARCEGENEFETLIEGVIILKEAEIIDKYCEIHVSIEQNNVFDVFMANKGKEVNLDATNSINGSVSLTAIRQKLYNFFNEDGTLIAVTAGDYVYGYEFYKALRHILRYISDGDIDLVSDFLTTTAENKTYNIEFTTTPVNNETVTFELTNQYGYTATYEVTSNGNATDFINKVKAVFLTNKNFEKADGSVFAGVITIDIEAYNWNTELANVTTTGSTVITTTETQAYVKGAKDMYISNGEYISNDLTDIFTISFDELMLIIQQQFFDLGMAFEKSGSQWYLRVEPLEYFFSNAVSVTLTNVDEVIITYDTNRLTSAVLLGSQQRIGLSSSVGSETFPFLNFANCTNVLDKTFSKDIRWTVEEISAQINGTEDYGDDLVIIQAYNNGGSIEPIKYENENVSAFGPPITFSSEFYMNDILEGRKLLQYHLFFLPDKVFVSASSASLTTVSAAGVFNTSASGAATYTGFEKQFYKLAEFNHPISFSDFRNIDEYSIIEFEHKGITYQGYILNLIHQIYTQETNMSLLIK